MNMEEVHETMSELNNLMNDNLCNDGFVQHDKEGSRISVMDSNEALDLDENDVVGRLIEANGNDSRNVYDISSKEINDSVMSDNDMFEDSFDKNHTEADDVETVLKSFESTTEGKGVSINLNEGESASLEERSNQHSIFDLLEGNNKDDNNISINGALSSAGEKNSEPQSTKVSPHILISNAAEVLNFNIKLTKKKPDSSNQALNDEFLMSHGSTPDEENSNVNNIIETIKNGESISNRIDMASSNKLTTVSNGHSVTENLSNGEKIKETVVESDIKGKTDSGKEILMSNTGLIESDNFLEEDEETEPPLITHHFEMSPSKQNNSITIIDENMERHDEYNDQANEYSHEEDGSNISMDNCENVEEKVADREVNDGNEKMESDDLEKSNCDHENKTSENLAENLPATESITATDLSDFQYSNRMAPKSKEIASSIDMGLILDPTYDSPESSSHADKVVIPPKSNCLRISPRSLLNNAVKSSVSPLVKKLKIVESVKLKTCHVNLKKVHVSDNYSPILCKPNLTKLKRKLEDMLYESTKQEEIGIKEIKKMRQERSRAYGNLLKELTRVKNKTKSKK